MIRLQHQRSMDSQIFVAPRISTVLSSYALLELQVIGEQIVNYLTKLI